MYYAININFLAIFLTLSDPCSRLGKLIPNCGFLLETGSFQQKFGATGAKMLSLTAKDGSDKAQRVSAAQRLLRCEEVVGRVTPVRASHSPRSRQTAAADSKWTPSRGEPCGGRGFVKGSIVGGGMFTRRDFILTSGSAVSAATLAGSVSAAVLAPKAALAIVSSARMGDAPAGAEVVRLSGDRLGDLRLISDSLEKGNSGQLVFALDAADELLLDVARLRAASVYHLQNSAAGVSSFALNAAGAGV